MRWYRFLPVLLTAGLAVFLTGALRPPSRARSAPAPAAQDLEPLPGSVDPGATALLGKAPSNSSGWRISARISMLSTKRGPGRLK